MKLLPENVPKISTTHAHAATNASRHAGENSGAPCPFRRNDAASKPSMMATMTAHFRMRHLLSTSARLAPRIAAIADSTSKALENECARKNTHPKQVR